MQAVRRDGTPPAARIERGNAAACEEQAAASRHADLDQLRRALGARRLTLDGVSYGTFVAEHRMLPRVPVLLLGGDRDLSTPLEWLHREAAMAPLGQVVVVPGAAHSVQNRAKSDLGRQAVYDFLLHTGQR